MNNEIVTISLFSVKHEYTSNKTTIYPNETEGQLWAFATNLKRL